MVRFFVEDYSFQLSKYGHNYCGDVLKVKRTAEATLAVLADGMGSGIPANMSANLVIEYLLGLLSEGFTIAEAVKTSLRSLRRARLNEGPWSAFNVARISPDGEVQVYSYESPLPLLLTAHGVEDLSFNPQFWEGEIVQEVSTHIRPGEALLFFTDGITQAGLGRNLRNGWGESGLKKYLARTNLGKRPAQGTKVTRGIVYEAASIAQNRPADDISSLLLYLRSPRVLQILVGPPAKKSKDSQVMKDFLAAVGTKAVFGGTTTKILASHMGLTPKIFPGEFGAPAHYKIEGIDLACEGAITLNRTNNIFDEPELAEKAGYGTERLIELFVEADEVYFWTGQSSNPANITTLKPSGMLSRNKVVAALAEKLRLAGKLVEIIKV